MSYTIRRMQRPGQQINIDPTTVETYWSRGHLPSPKEQADEADDLILWIGDNQPTNSTPVTGRELTLDAWIGGKTIRRMSARAAHTSAPRLGDDVRPRPIC
jgi:hypothetical protein